ncbi:MAG: hypothetical protein Q4D81_01435 [Eubacteriales bacterium]|nr:hypothetical protein [Eubacteriales bacterium]
MAIKNHPAVQKLSNGPAKPFYTISNMEIHEVGKELIQRASTDQNAAKNSGNIPSPFGESIALTDNILNPREEIRNDALQDILVMYIRLAEASFTGEKVTFHVRKFDKAKKLDAPCIRDLEKEDGWKSASDRLLDLRIDDVVNGIFMPNYVCFIPSAGFCEDLDTNRKKNDGTVKIHGEGIRDFLVRRPEVKNRCRAILSTMIGNGADERILSPLLEMLGGALDPKDMEKYRAEEMPSLPKEVRDYIKDTCPESGAEAACGYPGRNTGSRLLDSITLINTGPGAITHSDMKVIFGRFVAIPPVRDTERISDVSFSEGGERTAAGGNGILQPSWIEFSAKLDGHMYYKVYPIPEGGWRIRGPEYYIDLEYGVPDGILTRHNYLVRDMSAGLPLQDHEYDCRWKVFPEDRGEYLINLASPQFTHEHWRLRQRTSRIERLELWEEWEQGEASHKRLLGCVFPEEAPKFESSGKIAYVSIDPAGAESVRLWTYAHSGKTRAIEFKDLVYPITPASASEMSLIIERNAPPSERHNSHFESLLQMFKTTDAGFAELMVKSRIWEMDQKEMFKYLSNNPMSMVSAMSNLGVFANPKEMISRTKLGEAERVECGTALRHYIGILMLEAVLAMSKKGCSIQDGSLQFLISYPENGSGEGVTKMMKDAIDGAIEFVNEYLTDANTLRTGRIVLLYSESEASAQWHKNNPPASVYMGDSVPAGTPDYGHSTHDFSLRINGRLYMFSLPYAAQCITIATLAKVYKRTPAALMRCFRGGGQAFMQEAQGAITKAALSNRGNLYENLGFILPLSRLFSHCSFSVTGQRADAFQLQIQQIVEARLNVAIPAYADCIVRAIRDGVLTVRSEILLAPVGKGSQAINNTGNGYEERFAERLAAAIGKQLAEEPLHSGEKPVFTGRIRLLPNNDIKKESVAQGLIDLKEAGEKNRGTVPEKLSETELTDYYLDTLFDGESADAQERKTARREEIRNADTKATIKQYKDLRQELYSDVFKAVLDNYQYSDFVTSFNCWGYTGTSGGTFDQNIRDYARNNFENLKAELEQSRRELIMACPGREKEMVCGALIDLIIERL